MTICIGSISQSEHPRRKRFCTNVPLQRLFFMTATSCRSSPTARKRVAEEASNTARIQKVYKLVFGRAATPEEVPSWNRLPPNEPMKEYEDAKAARSQSPGGETDKDKDAKTEESPAPKWRHGGQRETVRRKREAEPCQRNASRIGGGGAAFTPGREKPDAPVTSGRYGQDPARSTEFSFIN